MTARSILRFRLSTLLLVVFSLATAALIWLRWEPWAVEMSSAHVHARSEDDRYVVVGSDVALELWDFETDRRRPLPFRDWPGLDEVKVRASAHRIATLENQNCIRLWNLETLRETGSITTSETWNTLFIMADDKVLIFRPEQDFFWELWDVTTKQPRLTKLNLSHQWPRVSSDGRFAVLAEGILDAHAERILEFPGSADDWHEFLDHTNLVIIANEIDTQLYDPLAEKFKCTLEGPHDLHMSISAINLDGRLVCYGQHSWDIETGKRDSFGINPPVDAVVTPDKTRYFKRGAFLCSTADDELLFAFPSSIFNALIFHGGRERMLVFGDGVDVDVWSRRHPEWWWGHFYRPEVWLGLLLSAVWLRKLFHSLRRRNS